VSGALTDSDEPASDAAPCYFRLASADELPPAGEDGRWLSPAERERAAAMAPQRRSDYRLGRWASKQALASLLGAEAPTLPHLEIRAAPDGSPLALVDAQPLPLQLSISHRQGRALCALRTGDDRDVGCDLERIEARSDAFLADFFTRGERELCASAGRRSWLAAALLWSVKESCLKALRTGLRRDSRSIEVSLLSLAPAPEPHGWQPVRAVDREASGEAAILRGWWRTWEGFVLTVAARAGAPPPCELAAPWR